MSDEDNKLYTVELTEDEIDQCSHALSEWYDRLLKDGHTRDMTAMKGFLNTIRKLDAVLVTMPIDTNRFAMGTPGVAHAGENKEVKPSTGQTWTHKQKGYDVKIDYINRTGDVVVEEVATGQRDGFGRKAFLERFSPKSKEGDA